MRLTDRGRMRLSGVAWPDYLVSGGGTVEFVVGGGVAGALPVGGVDGTVPAGGAEG